MNAAFLLDKTETSKFGEKDSVTYKALIAFLREVKDRLGFEIAVIGTTKNGDLFKFDISKKGWLDSFSTENQETELPEEVSGILTRMRKAFLGGQI